MEFEKLIFVIDKLYRNRNKYDLYHDDDGFSRIFNISTDEVRKSLFSFAALCEIDRTLFKKIYILQRKYRKLFGWDENINSIVEFAGYLGQRSDIFAGFLFQKIKAKVQEDSDPENDKYFLAQCISQAAKINPIATNMVYKLWFSNTLAPPKKKNSDFIETLMTTAVRKGIKDSIWQLDKASPEVITFLFRKLVTVEHSPLAIYEILNRVLGEIPIVDCVLIDKIGNYSMIQKDFSKEGLEYIIQNPPSERTITYYSWFSCWCRNSDAFKEQVGCLLHNKYIDVSLLTRYIKKEIKRGKFTPEESIDNLFEKSFLVKTLRMLNSDQRKNKEAVLKLWEEEAQVPGGYRKFNWAIEYVERQKDLIYELMQ